MCCYKGGKTDRIDKAIKLGLKTQEGYENVLEEMAEIRLKKVYQYGEDGYERGDIKFDMIMCYSDVYRKYIRLKRLIYHILEGAEEVNSVLAVLRETYLDLANYGVMGVHNIDLYTGEGDKEGGDKNRSDCCVC